MKSPKALGIILINSSMNSNLKPRKLERILIKLYRQNVSLLFNQTHTHTHTYIYIYIYIERERERQNPYVFVFMYVCERERKEKCKQ